MKVSVVTVCLNGAPQIEKTINSVLGQTYKDIEYIIIDGGSTDGTLEIIKKYEKNIARKVSEPDDGISCAFNKGLRLATGDIIGIISSDDWYEPDAVETAVRIFKDNPGAGVAHGDLQYWENGVREMYLMPSKDLSEIKREMVINHSTCFVKKEIYDKYGLFNEDLRYAMDYDLMLRFYVNSVQFVNAGKLMAHMSLGGKSDKNWYKAYREVLESNFRNLDSKFFSFMSFCFKVTRTAVRILLKKIGLNSVVVSFRTLQKRKKYEN